MNELKIKELTSMDWGSFTPEFSRGNEIVHVFNHCISTPEAVEYTIQFAVNRIKWCNAYFNNVFCHTVIIDDIGQMISYETREYIRNVIKHYATSFHFVSEEK